MTKKPEQEICHVCGKPKKPYVVFMKNDPIAYATYTAARRDDPICKRCDRYFAMTGDMKDPTDQEFEIAKKAAWFANMMSKWWTKDQKLEFIDDPFDPDQNRLNKRDWEGTAVIAEWCRRELLKCGRKRQ